MSDIRKGTAVLFDSGHAVIEGVVVSARQKQGRVLVEMRRENPDVQEARWWREPHKLLVIGGSK